jgi:hypothetical protein
MAAPWRVIVQVGVALSSLLSFLVPSIMGQIILAEGGSQGLMQLVAWMLLRS